MKRLMNYIRHLNAVFQKFAGDTRPNPTHISLYIALFQYWNIHRFPNIFFVDRAEIMEWSKIGSKATYHRCLHALHAWSYIVYLPSHNPYKGSRIKMLIFDTTLEQAPNKPDTSTEQAVVPNTNKFKQEKTLKNGPNKAHPKNLKEVVGYFKKKKWPPNEAKKFFLHYTAVGWKMGGKAPIKDWQAAAENWMLRSGELSQQHLNAPETQGEPNYLIAKTEKSYDEPL